MRTFLFAMIAGALSACATAPSSLELVNTGPIAGCCSADFNPADPTASAMVTVRLIPQEERLYFQPANVANRLAFLTGQPGNQGQGAYTDQRGTYSPDRGGDAPESYHRGAWLSSLPRWAQDSYRSNGWLDDHGRGRGRGNDQQSGVGIGVDNRSNDNNRY